MIKNNTPIEKYNVDGNDVFVKREDLCTQPPGPPFSKCRGLYAKLKKLKRKGITTVGYAESSISMAGWGVAWMAKELGMKAVIFDPQYVGKAPDLLIKHRTKWKKFGADIVPVDAGRTKVNYYIGKKYLDENNKYKNENTAMLPIGLRVPETVDATVEEWKRTMQSFKPDITIVPVGSGTIFAGIIKAAEKDNGDLIGVMLYTGNKIKKFKNIYIKSGKFPGSLNPPKVNVKLVNPGWEYAQFSNVICPFPCHRYYDLKAWEWLIANIDDLNYKKILFWNIGSEPDEY